MRDALCAEFGVSPMRMKALSQALSEASLRTEGGAGRGAATMTGTDVAIHAISAMLNLATKDAPDVIRSLLAMRLVNYARHLGPNALCEFPTQPSGSKLLDALTTVQQKLAMPEAEYPVPETFGAFLGQWVEGILDPTIGTYPQATGNRVRPADGTATLKISLNGHYATYTYVINSGSHEFADDFDRVEATYSVDGVLAPVRPKWENMLIITDAVFRRLREIAVETKK